MKIKVGIHTNFMINGPDAPMELELELVKNEKTDHGNTIEIILTAIIQITFRTVVILSAPFK